MLFVDQVKNIVHRPIGLYVFVDDVELASIVRDDRDRLRLLTNCMQWAAVMESRLSIVPKELRNSC